MAAAAPAVGSAACSTAPRRASNSRATVREQAANRRGSIGLAVPRPPAGPHRHHLVPSAIAGAPTEAPAAAADGARFDRQDWDAFISGYKSQYEERAYWVEDGMVEGTIPPELEGTLLRNGPGAEAARARRTRAASRAAWRG